jgi:pyruvate/2-oxoglutarate dehydrogenase complex dihydrolipoamide dehydrogenase (E3) component
VLLERTSQLGGQMAIAACAPGSGAIGRDFIELYTWRLDAAGVDVRCDSAADPALVVELRADLVVVATGARPFRPDVPLDGPVAHAWDVVERAPLAGRVVVTDWGGDPAGLDAAEALALAGNEVVLAVASVAVGETVHQYRRNLYLQRLYRVGVSIVHQHRLVGAADGEVLLANVFAPELVRHVPADLLVLAEGRVPDDALGAGLRALGLEPVEVGDCLSPRSLEEAVLEGTLAVRRLGVLT